MQALLLSSSGALAPSSAAAQRRGTAAAGRRAALVVRSEKGFSGGQGQKLPKQVKKSKRGKVASRPSPKLTLEQLQADQAAYEAAQAAGQAGEAPSSSAAPPAGSSSSGSGMSSGGMSSGSMGGGGGNRAVEYGSTAAVPEEVTNRMLGRIVLFMGAPVAFGVMLFPLFWYIKVVQDVDLPNWVAYVASSLTFGGGLLGITYGIMSASWDPRREGSLLGWTEFQANLPLLLDRFRRN